MKFFVAFALIVAVASATYVKPVPLTEEQVEIQEIIAAIQSPSTNPATAAALEKMLADLLGLEPAPVAVGPAMIEQDPVSVGPAFIPENPIVPTPIVVTPPTPSSPLVQIILNINPTTGAAEITPVHVSPVVRPEPADINQPIQIVDNWPVVEPVVISPVQVVDVEPVVIEPVIISPSVLPSPAVTLPEELN